MMEKKMFIFVFLLFLIFSCFKGEPEKISQKEKEKIQEKKKDRTINENSKDVSSPHSEKKIPEKNLHSPKKSPFPPQQDSGVSEDPHKGFRSPIPLPPVPSLPPLPRLGKITPQIQKEIEILKKHKQWYPRAQAARTLGNMGKRGESAIPALVASFQDSWGDVHIAAQEALRKIGAKALPFIVHALVHKHYRVRYSATLSLASFGPQAASSVPFLRRALHDQYWGVRVGAAIALGNMGDKAHPAIPDMLIHLTDSEGFRRNKPGVSFFVEKALLKLGTQVVPYLITLLKDDKQHYLIPANAATILGKIKGNSAVVVPALIQSLQHKSGQVQVNAIKALGELGASAEKAVPALIKALGSKNYYVQRTAPQTLGLIGKKARSALPALKSFRKKEKDMGIQYEIDKAIQQIEK